MVVIHEILHVFLMTQFTKKTVIKGLAGSGVQIVSISDKTQDFEKMKPKIKRWFALTRHATLVRS